MSINFKYRFVINSDKTYKNGTEICEFYGSEKDAITAAISISLDKNSYIFVFDDENNIVYETSHHWENLKIKLLNVNENIEWDRILVTIANLEKDHFDTLIHLLCEEYERLIPDWDDSILNGEVRDKFLSWCFRIKNDFSDSGVSPYVIKNNENYSIDEILEMMLEADCLPCPEFVFTAKEQFTAYENRLKEQSNKSFTRNDTVCKPNQESSNTDRSKQMLEELRASNVSILALWLFPHEDWYLAVESGLNNHLSYTSFQNDILGEKQWFEKNGVQVVIINTRVKLFLNELNRLGWENTEPNRSRLIAMFASRDGMILSD